MEGGGRREEWQVSKQGDTSKKYRKERKGIIVSAAILLEGRAEQDKAGYGRIWQGNDCNATAKQNDLYFNNKKGKNDEICRI